MYTCNAANIVYTKHRRGVDARATIRKDDKLICILHDEAISIQATVVFIRPADKAEFVAAARANGFDLRTDDYSVSEYARHIVMTAEALMAGLPPPEIPPAA